MTFRIWLQWCSFEAGSSFETVGTPTIGMLFRHIHIRYNSLLFSFSLFFSHVHHIFLSGGQPC